jgi:hypothetical protein
VVYIYGLKCPHSDAIRYIGKSVSPKKRLRAHIGAALRGSYDHHTARWIRKLYDSGHYPILVILAEVVCGEDWRDVERAWIQRAIDEKWPITNSTSGGEGLDYLRPEDELAYRQNHRAAMRRLASTDIGKRVIEKMRVAGSTPTARAKAAASIREAYKKPEVRDRLRRSMEIVRASPGFRESQSRGAKKAWAGHREKIMAAFARPETKAKQAERKRASWSDKETRARMMNRWTPEARALQAQRIRERYALIQSRMTPEVRARQGAKLKETWAKRKAAKECKSHP